MLKLIGRSLAGLFLTESAQSALKEKARTRKAPTANDRADELAELHAQAQDIVTPERAELIRQAMEIRRAKQQILADLGDEDRRKLVAAAVKRLLKEGKAD